MWAACGFLSTTETGLNSSHVGCLWLREHYRNWVKLQLCGLPVPKCEFTFYMYSVRVAQVVHLTCTLGVLAFRPGDGDLVLVNFLISC